MDFQKPTSDNFCFSLFQSGDIDGDAPSTKRLKSSSDALQDMVSGEELSLYGSAPNNTESAQVVYFSPQYLFPIFSALIFTHEKLF